MVFKTQVPLLHVPMSSRDPFYGLAQGSVSNLVDSIARVELLIAPANLLY